MNGKCKTEGDLTGQSCSCGYLAVMRMKCAQEIPWLYHTIDSHQHKILMFHPWGLFMLLL